MNSSYKIIYVMYRRSRCRQLGKIKSRKKSPLLCLSFCPVTFLSAVQDLYLLTYTLFSTSRFAARPTPSHAHYICNRLLSHRYPRAPRDGGIFMRMLSNGWYQRHFDPLMISFPYDTPIHVGSKRYLLFDAR